MDINVSIVLNNYNYSSFIVAAVRSAVNQSHRSCEVIVVDDGSTDNSLELLRSFEGRVQVISKRNGGQASAFNVGVAAAKGDYILLLDADDVLLPNAVEVALTSFPSEYSRVAWQLEYIDGDGARLPESLQQKLYPGFDGDAIQAYIEEDSFPVVPTSGNLFRADVLKAILPMPEEAFRISADSYLFVRSALHGPIKVLDQTLSQYRIHGSNNYQSGGNFFDPKTIQKHIEAALVSSELLESAAKERLPEFKDRRTVARLSTVLKIILARRMGLLNDRLTDWTFFRLIGGHFKYGKLPLFKTCLNLVVILGFRFLPMSTLRAFKR